MPKVLDLPITLNTLKLKKPSKPNDKRTKTIETYTDIARKAFHKSIEDLITDYGTNIKKDWMWSAYQGTDIHHLANIPGMGVYRLPTRT